MSIQWLHRDERGDRSALRRQVVLTEFGLGHVPAFRQVFVDHFAIRARALPQEPGWFRTSAGNLYEVVLTARSGEPVPSGLEVAALPARFPPARRRGRRPRPVGVPPLGRRAGGPALDP